MTWCRRRESEYSGLLKTRSLLIFRDAKNAENCQIAPNWNVSGTRDFQISFQFCEVFLNEERSQTAPIDLNHRTRYTGPPGHFTCPAALNVQVDYFRVRRKPSRIDATRGDHFLQADLLGTYLDRDREFVWH